MIAHIALFKWKQGTEKASVEDALKRVKELELKCPGITVHYGENHHRESKGLTHGIIVLAEDQKALDHYRKHEDHKKLAALIEDMEDEGLGFDFNYSE